MENEVSHLCISKIFRKSKWRSDELTSLWQKKIGIFVYIPPNFSFPRLFFPALLKGWNWSSTWRYAWREKMQSDSGKYRPHCGAHRSKLTWNWRWRKITNVHSLKHTWWKYYMCDGKWTIKIGSDDFSISCDLFWTGIVRPKLDLALFLRNSTATRWIRVW